MNLNNYFVDYESNIIVNIPKDKMEDNTVLDLLKKKTEIEESGFIKIDNVEYPVNYVEVLDKGPLYYFIISIKTLKDRRMVDNNYASRIKFE